MIKKDHKKSTSVIPRLDFSKVHEKYNSETMKKINVVQIKNPKNEKNKKENDLENEIKILNKKNLSLQEKLDKYRNGYKTLKDSYIKLKKSLLKSNSKIEFLETQIKRMTNRQSTEDITNKRCDIVENTSMVFINLNFFYFKIE